MAASCSGACSERGCSSEGSDGCTTGACAPKVLDPKPVCMKCKEAAAVVLANQTEPVCADCLRQIVLAKLKTVLNVHALVSPQDKILVAFSGGPASRVALELLCEIRSEALVSRALNAPAFGLGVLFVEEGLPLGMPAEQRQQAVDSIKKIVAKLELPIHAVALEDIFDGCDAEAKQAQLKKLFDSVRDATAKEDLVEILRMELLDQVAQANEYTKLVSGLCTTRIAARVISATAKGQGFSLPAGMQYVDTRWHAPVVLPLRDCASKELAFLCHYFQLETVFVRNFSTLVESSANTINSLCSNFVLTLREDNPARDRTIVRTAGKLIPFSFNEFAHNSDSLFTRKRRGGRLDQVSKGGKLTETLCTLCRAPLDDERNPSDQGVEKADITSLYCPSCEFQILYNNHSLLPQHLHGRILNGSKSNQSWMESQVKDYLIPEDG